MTKMHKALLTLAVLVAVLVAAFVGHGALAKRQAQQAQDAATSDASTEASGQSSDADTDTAAVALLADYDATVYTEAGESVLLSDIADGRPLVINFWATWCPYCVDELPDFQKVYADYSDRVNFAFVDVADGRRETVEDAAAWLAEQGFDDLPVYYDTTQEASTNFGAYGLPTTALITADGEVFAVESGRIDVALLRGALGQLV